MPNRPLIPADNFNTIIAWLDENLIENQKINACCIETANVPNEKGIYFWFMDPSCYERLHIPPISPVYQREIHGKWFDLVYIGTAGTGKKGNSNLKERLTWHLCQKHSEAAICSGALSTFRAGLSSLLAVDLILPETEKVFNEFVCTNMFIYWLAYDASQFNNIESDEKILIDSLRPIFNLKNNPNARQSAPTNGTRLYKQRRTMVKRQTLDRINCKGEKLSVMKKERKQTADAISYADQVLSESVNGCIEFFVQQGQDIAKVIRGINGLPEGPCTYDIWNSDNPLTTFNMWHRSTGRKQNGQNIYTYFSNINSKGVKRSDAIAEWMDTNKIEEITVRVCPTEIVPKNTVFIKVNKDLMDKELQDLKLTKPFKVVMICSSRKKTSFLTGCQDINFVVNPAGLNNSYHPDDNKPGADISWRTYLQNNQNDLNLKEAHNLYTNDKYDCLYRKYGDRFYILSAGWGLVRADYKLPKYDITFSTDALPVNQRSQNLGTPPTFNDFNHLAGDESNEDIIYIGSPDYLPLFFKLTANLKNRKIIYWKRLVPARVPMQYPAPNNSFVFRYYNTNARQNWHYKLADDICNV